MASTKAFCFSGSVSWMGRLPIRNIPVDRRAQTLADRRVVLLAQVIANVLAAALVADGHLVSAFAAPGDAMEEGGTVTWNAACLVVQIFRPIVAQHGLDALEGLPVGSTN
jgi:hypothetical protein